MMKTKSVNVLLENRVGGRFGSIAVASDLTGAERAHISKVAKGIRGSAGGLGWSYYTRGGLTTRMGVQVVDKTTGDVVASFVDVETASIITGISYNRLYNAVNAGRTIQGYTWSFVS